MRSRHSVPVESDSCSGQPAPEDPNRDDEQRQHDQIAPRTERRVQHGPDRVAEGPIRCPSLA